MSNSSLRGDTLRINYWVEPARVSRVGPASHLLFEPMFRGSYTAPGEVTAALVTRWEPSDDYRTWTYYIRSGVRWHDGTPLTAFDVKFSEDLRQHPTVGEPGTRRVRVVNDTMVEITYMRPMNPTPWRDIWPKHLLEDLDPEEFWEWDFWAQPVGSGPYRYVRHALTMAIDRRELARLRGYPDGAYARDVFAPQSPAGFDLGNPTPFDPDEARRILTQAGWVEAGRDGVRERDGEAFSFTLVVSEDVQEMEAARRVRLYLADVGVRVDIEPAPSARAAGERFWAGKVDAAMFRVSLGSIARMFESSSPVGFDDPELIRSWEAANAVWNPEERRQHLNRVMTRFRKLLPVTVLLPDVQFSVAHRRVKGLRSPDQGDLVEFLSELWIEEVREGAGQAGGNPPGGGVRPW